MSTVGPAVNPSQLAAINDKPIRNARTAMRMAHSRVTRFEHQYSASAMLTAASVTKIVALTTHMMRAVKSLLAAVLIAESTFVLVKSSVTRAANFSIGFCASMNANT